MSGQPSSVLLNNQQPEEVKVNTRSTRQPAAGTFKNFLSLVDGAIAKIETHQLSALIARIDGEHAWSVEVPINVAGTFKAMHIKINQQRTQSGDVQTPTTTFALELPLDEKRTLRALITLNTNRTSVRIWSEDPELLDSLVDNVGTLEASLHRKGFDNVAIVVDEIRDADLLMRTPERIVYEKA